MLCLSMGGKEDDGVAESPKFWGTMDWDEMEDHSAEDTFAESLF